MKKFSYKTNVPHITVEVTTTGGREVKVVRTDIMNHKTDRMRTFKKSTVTHTNREGKVYQGDYKDWQRAVLDGANEAEAFVNFLYDGVKE